jgi:predicted phage-related endonuclease
MSDDRRARIGGSDIAAVVGLDPRRTPLDLWFLKTASEPPPPPDPKLARFFARRKRQEPVVAEMLRDEGIEVTKLSWGEEENRYKDVEHPWMVAEVDFEFRMNEAARERFEDRPEWRAIPDGETLNGEIKTASVFTKWKFGEEGTEEMPVEHAAQMQWGMMVARRRACLGAVLVGVDDLLLYPTMRDDATIAWLRSEALRFWEAHVLARVAPEPRNVDDFLNLYRRFAGKPVELDDVSEAAVADIFALRDQIKVAKQGYDEAEFKLFEHVRKAWGIPADPTAELPGDNAVFTKDGRPVAVWRRQNGSSLDQKRLAAEHPEIIEQYRRRTTFRVLAAPPKPKRRKE